MRKSSISPTKDKHITSPPVLCSILLVLLHENSQFSFVRLCLQYELLNIFHKHKNVIPKYTFIRRLGDCHNSTILSRKIHKFKLSVHWKKKLFHARCFGHNFFIFCATALSFVCFFFLLNSVWSDKKTFKYSKKMCSQRF